MLVFHHWFICFLFYFILFYLIHFYAGPRPPHSKKQNTSTRILFLQENILKEKNLEKWQCVDVFLHVVV